MAVALRGAYLTGIRTRVSRVKAVIYYENHSSVSCSSIRVCFRAPSGVLSFPAIAFRLTHPSVITIYTMKYRSTPQGAAAIDLSDVSEFTGCTHVSARPHFRVAR